MVAYQADVLFWFLGQQLFKDLHSTVDRKLVNNRLLLQHLIAKHTLQNIFVNFPAGRIFVIHGSLDFCYLSICSVKKCSFVFTVANLYVLTYSGWM